MIQQGTKLVHRGTVVFESTAPVTAAIRLGRNDLDGYVGSVGEYELNMPCGGRVPTQPMFANQMIAGTHRYVTSHRLDKPDVKLEPFTWTVNEETGVMRLRLVGRGALRVPLAIPHNIP
jgi:hypothetical protein